MGAGVYYALPASRPGVREAYNAAPCSWGNRWEGGAFSDQCLLMSGTAQDRLEEGLMISLIPVSVVTPEISWS